MSCPRQVGQGELAVASWRVGQDELAKASCPRLVGQGELAVASWPWQVGRGQLAVANCRRPI